MRQPLRPFLTVRQQRHRPSTVTSFLKWSKCPIGPSNNNTDKCRGPIRRPTKASTGPSESAGRRRRLRITIPSRRRRRLQSRSCRARIGTTRSTSAASARRPPSSSSTSRRVCAATAASRAARAPPLCALTSLAPASEVICNLMKHFSLFRLPWPPLNPIRAQKIYVLSLSLLLLLLFCLAPIRPFHLAIRPAIYLACLGLEATLRRPRQVGVRETERERERKRSRTVRTKPLLLSLRLLDAAGNKSIDPKPECEQCVESADWTTLLRTWGGKRVEIFVSIKSKGGNGWTHRSHCWCWAIKKKGPSARRFILTRRWESARLLLMPRPRVLLPA